MRKYVCWLFLASFLGIMANPEILTASDSVKISDLNQNNLTETIIPETTTRTEFETVAPGVTTKYERTTFATNTTEALAPVVNAPSDYIKIAGQTINIVTVDNTTVDAGNHVNTVGKLFYGHNLPNVFGGLKNLSTGDTFAITFNGVTTKYRINKIMIFEKNLETGRLQIDGKGNYMTSIKNTALGHDVALMTCAGESLTGGDATHRLVILADKI